MTWIANLSTYILASSEMTDSGNYIRSSKISPWTIKTRRTYCYIAISCIFRIFRLSSFKCLYPLMSVWLVLCNITNGGQLRNCRLSHVSITFISAIYQQCRNWFLSMYEYNLSVRFTNCSFLPINKSVLLLRNKTNGTTKV